ncbi:MAG: macro domain-containing protein [Myxococcota bacterium]
MDVTLVNRSVFDLPSKQRVGAIVYDGTADMQLWPGPGPDKELQEHYGDDLQRNLDAELKQTGDTVLEPGAVIRVHPGRLHCNFLAWVALRDPEPGTERSTAPAAEAVRAAVLTALEFAAERSVERVAFPAIGSGTGELERGERLAIVVEAAEAYQAKRTEEGKPPVVEEVLVCEANGPAFRAAKKAVKGKAKVAEKEAAPAKKKAAKKTTRKRSTPAKPKITADELATHKASAETYSPRNTYVTGDFFNHTKFGLGKVLDVPMPDRISVVFEDGALKTLLHGRG